jgi:hypothetical protein
LIVVLRQKITVPLPKKSLFRSLQTYVNGGRNAMSVLAFWAEFGLKGPIRITDIFRNSDFAALTETYTFEIASENGPRNGLSMRLWRALGSRRNGICRR